jgi:N-succinyldiaminopimelate aminotransferase
VTSSRPRLVPHLAGLGTTIFAEMSALAVSTGSINLGQGFPDTDGPRSVAEAAARAVLEGRGNQYPPGPGIPELRRAITAHQLATYGIELDPDSQVLVTAGATEAIAAAMLALVDEGDEVVALEPYYDSYAATIEMARGVRVPVTLRAPDFALHVDELRTAITPRTRVILLNSPHNPTGAVLSRADLLAVAELAVEHDLVVVSDEVYEHLIFDGAEHVPICTLPGMADRTVELVTAVRTTKQFLTFVSAGPFQYAVAEALALPPTVYDDLRIALQAQRDLLCAGLADLGFEVYLPRGTYFATTDGRPLGWDDGLAFCRELPARCGVVAIPHQVFYDDLEAGRPLVRWAFCKRPEVLHEALDRLRSGQLRR